MRSHILKGTQSKTLLYNAITKTYTAGYIGVIILALVLLLVNIGPGHDWGDDFAMYLSQTEALINGTTQQLYEQNKYSMDHSVALLGPYLYPPVFPLLLTPAAFITGFSFIGLKVYCTLFFIASLYIFKKLFDALLFPPAVVFFSVCFIAIHPVFTSYSNYILSEFPFQFFFALSLYLIVTATTWRKHFATLVCILLTVFIRDVGVVLLLAYVIKPWLSRWKPSSTHYRTMGGFCLVVAALLIIKNYLHDGGANHIAALKKQTFQGGTS